MTEATWREVWRKGWIIEVDEPLHWTLSGMAESLERRHQLPLTGLERKEQGQQAMERHSWVHIARVAAERFCLVKGRVCSDDLHDVMPEPPHPNCFGAIFHDKRFTWDGWYVKSKRPEAHYRDIKVWRLR